MSSIVDVLNAVSGRVDHLQAIVDSSPGDDWIDCDTIGPEEIETAITQPGLDSDDRVVVASLLVQSYAHRIGAVSLASYAMGLPWPMPNSASTAVRVADGRARSLCFRNETLGESDDVESLLKALVDEHLVGFVAAVRTTQRIGERLLWANVASSWATAFRAIEGAARARGDTAEELRARKRGADFMQREALLADTGHFEDSSDWVWRRSACCLWYRTSGGRLCQGCSLRKD